MDKPEGEYLLNPNSNLSVEAAPLHVLLILTPCECEDKSQIGSSKYKLFFHTYSHVHKLGMGSTASVGPQLDNKKSLWSK